jgi:hypothetical protein
VTLSAPTDWAKSLAFRMNLTALRRMAGSV